MFLLNKNIILVFILSFFVNTLKRPLHNRENLAVVTEKNIQLTVIARHFGRK